MKVKSLRRGCGSSFLVSKNLLKHLLLWDFILSYAQNQKQLFLSLYIGASFLIRLFSKSRASFMVMQGINSSSSDLSLAHLMWWSSANGLDRPKELIPIYKGTLLLSEVHQNIYTRGLVALCICALFHLIGFIPVISSISIHWLYLLSEFLVLCIIRPNCLVR